MDFVDHRKIDIAGLFILTDTLNFIRLSLRLLTRSKHLCEDRTLWIRADNPDLRVLLLEKPRYARNCASGAYADHYVSHLPFCLFPDLRTGAVVVRLRIRGV